LKRTVKVLTSLNSNACFMKTFKAIIRQKQFSLRRKIALVFLHFSYFIYLFIYFFLWHNSLHGPGPRHFEVYKLHTHARTHTHTHTPPGRMIGSSQWTVSDNTQRLTTDRYPCLRRNSNPQSQEANDRRLSA
jgi:hypothetical protein